MLKSALILSVLAAFVHSINPGPEYPPTKGEVWPKPQKYTSDDTYYTINPSEFSYRIIGQQCQILTNAIERYSFIGRDLHRLSTRNLRRSVWKRSYTRRKRNQLENFKGSATELVVNLTQPCEESPYLGMIESYSLTTAATSVLTSQSIWGILRGLETWSQIFYLSDNYNEIRFNTSSIEDFPQYPHRGLLIDTSRHYIALNNILKTLDAMAMNKMNVLHWHIVDDQSFPYQSKKFPDISRLGAYRPNMVYSEDDIKLVVGYAKDRGIRVLPEFDVPGHTRSWGEAYPNILTKCYENGKVTGLGPMDPTQNVTYKLLQDLFQEVQQLFPDKYFHVGGDEVEMDCWRSNPDIQEYMRVHHLNSPNKLHALFMRNVIPLLGQRSTPIVWQEVFDEGVKLSSDTLVQVWKWTPVTDMISVLRAGHRLIYSSSWYLDHLASGGDWADFYLADPRQMVHNASTNINLENIVGGEACMWGEVVNDMNVISRVWPRASAVAERLWSPQLDYHNVLTRSVPNEVRARLEEHTCRMNRRGINAQPPNGPGFCVGAVF